jgi:hypothetical protein
VIQVPANHHHKHEKEHSTEKKKALQWNYPSIQFDLNTLLDISNIATAKHTLTSSKRASSAASCSLLSCCERGALAAMAAKFIVVNEAIAVFGTPKQQHHHKYTLDAQ